MKQKNFVKVVLLLILRSKVQLQNLAIKKENMKFFSDQLKKFNFSHYYITEDVAIETLSVPELYLPITSSLVKLPQNLRTSKEYQDLFSKLKELNVGKKSGFNDRRIVADLFFLEKEANVIPVFVTADKGIYNPSCRSNCSSKREEIAFSKYMNSTYFPNSFRGLSRKLTLYFIISSNFLL